MLALLVLWVIFNKYCARLSVYLLIVWLFVDHLFLVLSMHGLA
jgi:hypothetical protein